jgi:hypothetical protein
MNGGEGGCRQRAAVDMVGGPAPGKDATDYDVGILDKLRKSVLFDEKDHCGVEALVIYTIGRRPTAEDVRR